MTEFLWFLVGLLIGGMLVTLIRYFVQVQKLSRTVQEKERQPRN